MKEAPGRTNNPSVSIRSKVRHAWDEQLQHDTVGSHVAPEPQ